MSKTHAVLSTRVSHVTKAVICAVAAARGIATAEWMRQAVRERLVETRWPSAASVSEATAVTSDR